VTVTRTLHSVLDSVDLLVVYKVDCLRKSLVVVALTVTALAPGNIRTDILRLLSVAHEARDEASAERRLYVGEPQ
jgi:hypothetical protein